MGNSAFLSDLFAQAPRTPELAGALATQTASGLTPGKFVLDAALANLPPNVMTQAARIQTGTALSAGQNADLQVGMAGINERANEASMQNALGTAELDFKGAAAKSAAMTAADSLMTNKASILKSLQGMKDPAPQVVLGFVGALNAINAQLTNLGLPNEGQIPLDAAQMVQPGWLQKFFSMGSAPDAPPAKIGAGAVSYNPADSSRIPRRP